MSQRLKDERDLLSPPGEDILEHIDYIKMSQAELANRLGKTPSKVNDLITGKEPITYTTALQLERVLGIDANYWLNREIHFREKLARLDQLNGLEDAGEWVKEQPTRNLEKSGYLKPDKKGTDLVAETLEFYGVASPEQWQALYVDGYTQSSFRKSPAHRTTLSSMAAWLRIGEIEMQKLSMTEYDKVSFKLVLKEIKSLVKNHPDDFAKQLQVLCLSAGVAVIYTISLPKAPISGATRWFRNNPLIQLTDRHKTNDQFWFTFFHEAGHVLLHGKKEVFLEDFSGYKLNRDKENEANRFAMNWLLPDKAVEELPNGFTDKDIIKLAKLYHTHPGIIAGRLQWLGEWKHSQGNHHKIAVSLFN